MKTYVTAIIINWNGAVDTLELVKSLCEQKDEEVSIDVIIVDNASEDNDLLTLKDGLNQFSEIINIELICNKYNQGVPYAYNQAIKSSKDKESFFLRLDNDVVILPGGLKKLIHKMYENKPNRIRLVGGNIRFYDKPEINNGGAYTFDFFKGKTRITYPDKDVICDGVLGCVMLIDSEVIKLFYPDVFLSWLFLTTDESELSLRCKSKNWLTYYISDPIALHKGGRSTQKVPNKSTLLSIRNWSYLSIVYSNKIVLFVVIIRLIITILYKAMKLQFNVSTAIIKGMYTAIFRRGKLPINVYK